jgi:hypothetical protein
MDHARQVITNQAFEDVLQIAERRRRCHFQTRSWASPTGPVQNLNPGSGAQQHAVLCRQSNCRAFRDDSPTCEICHNGGELTG